MTRTHGVTRVTLTDGDAAVRQKIYLRLSLIRGEYAPDQSAGIPYLELLARKDDGALLERHLRAALASTPGVDALITFDLVLDRAARTGTLHAQVRTTGGTVLTIAEYRLPL